MRAARCPCTSTCTAGSATPTGYLPLTVAGTAANGYRLFSNSTVPLQGNYTPGTTDLFMTNTPYGNFILPADVIVKNAGYVWNTSNATSHGGYITKGDNNNFSDQGSLVFAGTGPVEPVQKDWVVGKALFAIPLVGLLPLNIVPVIIVVIILMVLYELWLRRQEENQKTAERTARRSKKKR